MVSLRLSFCSGEAWVEPHLPHGILATVIALNPPLSDLDLLENSCPLCSAFVLSQRSVLAIECDLNS